MKNIVVHSPEYGKPPFCDCFLYWGDSEYKFCTLCGKSYEDYSKLYKKEQLKN